MAVDAAVLLESLGNVLTSLMSLVMINQAVRNALQTQDSDSRVARILKYVDRDAYEVLQQSKITGGFKLMLIQEAGRERRMTEKAVEETARPWIRPTPTPTICENLPENLPALVHDYVTYTIRTPFVNNWSMALSGLRDMAITGVAGPCARISMALVAGRLLLKWLYETISVECGRVALEISPSELAPLVLGNVFNTLNITPEVATECGRDIEKLKTSLGVT
jgi:hypothetical protein